MNNDDEKQSHASGPAAHQQQYDQTIPLPLSQSGATIYHRRYTQEVPLEPLRQQHHHQQAPSSSSPVTKEQIKEGRAKPPVASAPANNDDEKQGQSGSTGHDPHQQQQKQQQQMLLNNFTACLDEVIAPVPQERPIPPPQAPSPNHQETEARSNPPVPTAPSRGFNPQMPPPQAPHNPPREQIEAGRTNPPAPAPPPRRGVAPLQAPGALRNGFGRNIRATCIHAVPPAGSVVSGGCVVKFISIPPPSEEKIQEELKRYRKPLETTQISCAIIDHLIWADPTEGGS